MYRVVAFRCGRYSGTGTPLLASQHSEMEGGSAAINDHDERVAVGLWQLLQTNVEELDGDEEADRLPSRSSSASSRTHPASFFTSLSTHFILRVHPFVRDSVVAREPRVIAVARRFHLDRGDNLVR